MRKDKNKNDEKFFIQDFDGDSQKGLIIVDDDSNVIIEHEAPTSNDVPEASSNTNSSTYHRHKWMWIALGIFASVVFCFSAYCGWRLYNYYYHIGVPISVSPEENIAKLSKPHTSVSFKKKETKPEIVLTSDSILGVTLNMYELKNLQAEITLAEPDSTDKSVWMYSRCADHTSDGKYLGSLVMQGKELASDASRLGYCAMANGNIVLGISRSDKVKDYVMEHGGSFFRQFILVSDGVLPPKFQLHGKVERRALARTSDDHLYYIETRHAETLWDFADALREYGFADAIYITGGKCHSFYRTPDGKPHSIGDETQHPHKKYQKIVPWIVFKAR